MNINNPKETWDEFSEIQKIEELENREEIINDYTVKLIDAKLIIEQFQKLLGVYTTTEALAKVAVLMREETEAERLLSKALGHFQTCPEAGSNKLYQEIAEVFGAASVPPVEGWKPSGVIQTGESE